jgi:antirestriction protein ArdC
MQQEFNRNASAEERRDAYTKITELIIADLEQGVRPWVKPWLDGAVASRPVRHNGQPYSGINVLALWSVASDKGFGNPMWMTFKQAKELDGCVRKGEKGSVVVYSNRITKTETNDAGESEDREIPFLRGYSVFNVEQIGGLPEEYYAPRARMFTNPVHRIEYAETFFAATGAEIRFGGNRAFYAPSGDYVQLPPIEMFPVAERYYATLAHEMTHWTRHPDRLNRDFGGKRFGDEGYAVEELVAEMGAAFLCADLEMKPQIREDHAPYIASWLKVLKNDKRAIFHAASHAQRAADFLVKSQRSLRREAEADPIPQVA